MNDILDAANEIVCIRQQIYGSPADSFEAVAAMWSELLNTPINARQVVYCMIALKLVRLSHMYTFDSVVDVAGYAAILDELYTNKHDE